MSSVWSCSWSPATVQNNKPPCCHASERVLCTKPLCRVFMSHPPKVQETVLHSSAAWPTYESMNPFIFLFVWQPLTKRTSVTKEKFPWRHCPSTADLVPSSEPNRDGGRGTKGPRGLATDVYVSMVQVRLRLARVPVSNVEPMLIWEKTPAFKITDFIHDWASGYQRFTAVLATVLPFLIVRKVPRPTVAPGLK